MTSPDGITWTSRTSAADNSWNSVTYGGSTFVAVAGTGSGSRVMTSPDGINWTVRTSAADNTWNSVAFANNLFVAVAQSGTGNRVMTAPVVVTATETFTSSVANGANFTNPTHYTTTNLPGGLTLNIRKDTSTTATILISGSAASHANIHDVSNFTITWATAAFTQASLASDITDYAKNNFIFNFTDPNSGLIEFSSATAASSDESTANNFPKILVSGVLTTPQTVTVSVTGGTATGQGVDFTHGTLNALVVNIPAGTYDGTLGTAITITAPTLNNDILGEAGGETIILGFTSPSSALTVGDASGNLVTASAHTYTISDDDKALNYAASSLTESIINNGSFSGTLGFTLSGATFALSGNLTAVSHYIATNVPGGLTMVVNVANTTTGTVSFTGTATAHTNAADVANIGLAFNNIAFTGGNAASIAGSTKTDIALDFIDQSITYGGSGFVESASNTGSVTGSITATISGATFINPSGTLALGSNVTVANIPGGFTGTMSVNGAGTVATLTVSGSATLHGDAQDVASVTFLFADSAFAGGALAANITNATGPYSPSLGFNFKDIALTYATTTFVERAANDGVTTTTSALTLTGDTFVLSVGNFTQGVHYTVSNLPVGMSMTIAATSNTAATVSITGTAAAHANANDVANLTVTWLDAAFTLTPAAGITNYNKSDLVINFADPAAIVWSGTFAETNTNTGAVSGSRVATLTGDTFVNAGSTLSENTHYTLANVPAGLTASMAVDGAGLVATLTFTGSATTHTNAVDVANLTVTFSNGAFTNTTTASNVSGYTNTAGVIDFKDVALTYDSSTFIEAAALDGSVSTVVNVTLAGDTFTQSSGAFTLTTHYTVANLSGGLTAVVTATSATTATVALSGTAAAHANANDVANFTLVWTNAAFTLTPAAGVTNSTKADFIIDFGDAAITYTGAGFTESTSNNGTVTGSIIATLASGGPTFKLGGSLTVGVDVTLGNVPGGLTAAVATSGSDLIATVTLSGTAATHTNAVDVSDITFVFTDSAFTGGLLAASVAGSGAVTPASSGLGIDFRDVTLTYSTATFTESTANDGTIANTATVTLAGDTFAAPLIGGNLTLTTHYTVANVPAGLTTLIAIVDATTATVSFTGAASAHASADSVTTGTLAFTNAVFTTTPASNITNASRSDLAFTFANQASIAWAGNFTETATNNGTVSGTRTGTITGDTFVSGISNGSTFVVTTHYTIANVTSGLTATLTKTSPTVATLTLAGTASTHAVANNVTNLTIAFANGVFTTTPVATNVTGSTNATGTITYLNQPVITWAGSFAEAVANDGSVTGTRTATLVGDTFINAGSTLTSGIHYTTANVPGGLTANVAVDGAGLVATVTLTGNATAHAPANNTTSMTITFLDGVFNTTTLASSVTGYTNAAGSVTFLSNATGIITYSTSTFTESAANGGAIGNSITMTLIGDNYAPTITLNTHITVTNVPAGLTASVARTSGTVLTLSLTGTATVHTAASSVSNVTVTLADSAFATLLAAQVTGSTKSDIAVTYIDVGLSYSVATFDEPIANNGSVTTTSVVTLSGDTFILSAGNFTSGVHYTTANVPGGLTMVIAATAATTATVNLTGTAGLHANANDVANMTIAWNNAAFTNAPAANITNSTKADFVVNFLDQASIAYAGSFTENQVNDGTLSGSRTATITGDTFVNAGATLTENTHFTLANKPAGTTAVMNVSGDGLVATLTLTGGATTHTNAVDVANLGITFNNGAFTNTTVATNVTNSSNTAGVVDFRDVTIAYSASSFAESAALDGTVSGSSIITLTGEVFSQSSGTFTASTHYTIANVPAGLTAVLTVDSATQATLTFTGTAASHGNGDDRADVTLTFLNAAFTATPAANITNYTKNNFVIDFGDASITYGGLGFTETVANSGAVTGSITATLTGDVWNAALSLSDVTIGNVSAGFTTVLTRTSDTVATLTLTGGATTHTNALDVADITFVWADTALTGVTAAVTAGSGNVTPASSARGINFLDVTFNYATTTFTEVVANDGSTTTTSALTLVGDTFTLSSGNFTAATHYNVTNLPAGMTMVITASSNTAATVSITGNATLHANSNDVSNLTITWLNAALTNSVAAGAINGAKADFVVDFADQPTITWAGSFAETVANAGAVSGSRTGTLAGDTFIVGVADGAAFTLSTHYTVANVPTGLTAVLTKTSSVVATLTLTGTASSHASANSASNLTVAFLNGVFTTVPLAVNVTNYQDATGVVTLNDPASIVYAGSFTEHISGNGTVTGSRTSTLTGDTFVDAGATLTSGVHFAATNVPTGLTAVMTRTSPTVATLTLTGTAASHAPGDSISNLTITWLSGAFTNTANATNVTNFTNAVGVVTFNNPGTGTLTYSSGTFVEGFANNGSINNSLTLTLAGDTFAANVILGAQVTVTNVPTGLTAGVTRVDDTTVTVTLSGNATSHANANDVSNLTVTFADSAFAALVAVNVTNSAKADIIVNFSDNPTGSIAYSTGTFVEALANDGSVGTAITATLSGPGTYAATLTAGGNVTFSNVPSGLTGAVARTSATVATLTLTGNASAHLTANDVANVGVVFADAAFTGVLAADVVNSTKSDFAVDFNDQASIVYAGTFAETAANGGAVSGSRTSTITGDTFVTPLAAGTHAIITNAPAGLTAVLTRTSPTVATLTFTGNATAHANAQDVSTLTITWQNGAFTNTTLAANVTNPSNALGAIDFTDPASIVWAGSFTETQANTGAVTGSRTATLTGDTFIAGVTDGNAFTATTHYTVANIPTGLTAVVTKTSSTVATVTLTGSATTHTNAVDASNLTVTFVDGVFTNTAVASNVTGYTNAAGSVDFIDKTVTYSSSIFTEAASLNGSIGNTITATINATAGDSFVITGGVMTLGAEYSATNVPGGLTAVVTGTSATTATITLSGTAAAHANANDVANVTITFLNAAFTSGIASSFTGAANTYSVDYGDATIAYSGAGFTETAANTGAVTGSIIATLTGDTWNAALSATDVTLGNVPAGLTAVLTRTSGTVATLTLTGSATTHTNAVDVADITFVFANSAFTTAAAANVSGATGPASSALGVNFFDVTFTYGTATFVESAANDGSTTTTSTITLAGDTFVLSLGNFTSGVHFTPTNVPTGLTANIAATSSTTATLSLTGSATSHASAQDVANMTITWSNAALTNSVAANAVNYAKNDLAVDFNDQASIVWAGSFTETVANGGAVTGTRTATITGDTYTGSVANAAAFTSSTHYVVTNLPAGLTAVLTKTSGTVATLTFTASASAHAAANNTSSITVTFLNGAFSNTSVAANVTGYTNAAAAITFLDQASITYAGSFAESIADDGTVTGSRTSNLIGDTFDGPLVEGVDYTLTNKPAGLTAVMTVTTPTVATLTFTGAAGTHTNASDVSNLTITWLDGAFTNTALAVNVTNYTSAVGVVDFIEAGTGSITYDGTTFNEAASNNGTIANVLTLTLSGDTYAANLTVGTNVTVTNVPTGLTATTTRVSGTVATLSLTGNAATHTNAADISNLTVVFGNGAFVVLPALQITNSSKNNIAVNFNDNATGTLTYATTTFAESTANNGAITATSLVTLAGGVFAATLTANTHVTFTNTPAGLTATITRNSDTTATIGFTGVATAHTNAADISNFTATWADAAFVGLLAADVTGAVKNDLALNFADQASIAYAGTFTEAAANDGSVTGALTMTLTGDTFVTPLGTPLHAVITNVPTGLTSVLTRTSATVATLTFTGNATAHTNLADVNNVTVTWQNGAFANTSAAVDVTNSTYTTGSIDFVNQASVAWSGNFTEVIANDGSVSGSRTATITGDLFTSGVAIAGTFTSGVHYTPANIPVGLTSVLTKTSTSVATLTLTGNAGAHANVNDVSTLTITLLNGAFENTLVATNVTGYSDAFGGIDFADQASITYSGSFAETAGNIGQVTGSSRVSTITGDTFVATLTENTHFTLANKPAGLTAVMTRTSPTTAELTFTGSASSHNNANDVSNLTITWSNGAFTNTTVATNVAGYTNNVGVVDFIEPGTGSITYDTTTFVESPSNNGSISTVMTLTLAGDTYATNISVGSNVTVTNVPTGLTAAITRVNGTTATLVLAGNATSHANANDVGNVIVQFADSAFTSLLASQVTFSTKTGLGVNFNDSTTATITYSSGTFTESVANDGAITATVTATISGAGTYGATLTAGVDVTFTNAPAGLTATITRNSGTVATIGFTGNAAAHTNAADIANFTATWADSAFVGVVAADVTGSTKSDFVVDFANPASIAYSGSFVETNANDGTVSGSITATLTGDTYVNPLGAGVHVLITNVPTGLTASAARTSSTLVTVTLAGTAASHTNVNDVANLTITWQNGAFTNVATATNVTNNTYTAGSIDFVNQASVNWAGNFTENVANNGTVTGSRTATLSGDTFIASVTDGTAFTLTTHYTVANVPTGLTAVVTKTSSTIATVTLTGTAASHANANDVANLTVAFVNGVFTNTTLAANVTGYSDASGVVDFADQATIVYSGSFTETGADNGAVAGSRTGTLVGDTWAATLTIGGNVTITNVPAGLTAVMTRTSATVATLTLTGNATSHANANDVSNLTITWLNGAFTNTTAATNVNGYSDATGSIDFIQAGTGSIAYDTATFTESGADNGSISNVLTLTLSGDTFAATIALGTQVTVTNIPAGLSAAVTRVSGSVVTIGLTGNATTHASANNIANLTVTFADSAFATLTSLAVTNSAKSNIAVTFVDTASGTLTYAASTFTEAVANNGSISNTIGVTLSGGGTFAPTLTTGTDVTFTNVPAGLTGVVTRNSTTSATLSLTGNATNHANANDIANLTVTWANSAFSGLLAVNVTGSTNSTVAVDFADPTGSLFINYNTATFVEAVANNGTITQTVTATLGGDTFVGSVANAATFTAGTHYNATNVPAGLTLVLTKTSSTGATVGFSGTAAAHANANDVANVTIAWTNSAFTLGNASLITNSTKSDFAIDFQDPPANSLLSYNTATFPEAAANNGSITATVTGTLSGSETFIGSVANAATFTSGTHYTPVNVPTGLTMVVTKTSSTTATVGFSGTATSHANANDVANVGLTWLNAAFTGADASTVTNYNKNDFIIDFADPASSALLNYNTATFVEAAANDGSITQTITGTLTGDFFTGSVANSSAFTSATHYSATNVPTGLTMVITKTSSTVATVSFTGTATAHANANDVANLTIVWTNAAFLGANAVGVTNYNKSDFVIDFADTVPAGAGALTYSTLTFSEAVANNGTISNSVSITLTNDTFVSTLTVGTNVLITNVPSGLSASLTRNSGTSATLALTGTASAHESANSITNTQRKNYSIRSGWGFASNIATLARPQRFRRDCQTFSDVRGIL
jgi:hypothetical protein